MLMVLDGGRLAGQGPEVPGSRFWCRNCGLGIPLKYFSFPRSDLNEATREPYNRTAEVSRRGGHIYTRTVEDPKHTDATFLFRFSRDFVLQHAAASDGWPSLHKRREAEGKITHGLEGCPFWGRPLTMQAWTPEAGWQAVTRLAAPAAGARP